MSAAVRAGRRGVLAGLVAAPLAAALPARSTAFAPHGRIDPPQRCPAIATLRDDGAAQPLATLLEGRITAVQFMFTACTSLCPILGASFVQVQEQLRPGPRSRLALLSISVDALGETPATLQAWRRRLGAVERWRAAVPRPADADRLTRWAAGAVPFAFDTHASQILLFDSAARLVYRTADLPRPEELVRLMHEIDASPGT